MVNDRRAGVPGGACFFTVTLRDRRKSYLIDHADPFGWRWSSIHAYARQGIIGRDWIGRDQQRLFGD